MRTDDSVIIIDYCRVIALTYAGALSSNGHGSSKPYCCNLYRARVRVYRTSKVCREFGAISQYRGLRQQNGQADVIEVWSYLVWTVERSAATGNAVS